MSSLEPKENNGKPYETLLRLGDEIIFYDQSNHILTAQNPLETRACVRPNSLQTAIGTTLFRLEPQQSYMAQKELEAFMGENDLETLKCEATPEELDQLVLLEQKAAKEIAQNETEKHRLLGKPVLYGQVVQLFNQHFQKYLTVTGKTRQSSTHHQHRLQVNLSSDFIGYFRIMPRYRIRFVGDAIRVGETVALQCVRPEGYLNVDYTQKEEDEYPVYSHTQISSWGMKLHYSSVSDQDTKHVKYTNSGHYIRLYHKEMESYLEAPAMHGDTVVLKKHLINPLDPKESDSPLAFWEIENVDTSRGSKVRWKKPIRIRHAVSRSYLSIDPSHVRIDIATGKTTFTLKLLHSLTHVDTSQDTTLFQFMPVSAPAMSGIPYGSFVRMKHIMTECWMHAADSEDSPLPQPPTMALSPANFSTWKHIRFQSTDSSFSSVVEQTIEPLDAQDIMGTHWDPLATYYSITASPEFYYHDCFSITRVDQALADTFNFANEMIPPLQRYLSQDRHCLANDPYPVEDAEYELVCQILKTLIEFCTQSKETNPTKREGLPIEYHQTILRDMNMIELVIHMIRVPFYLTKRRQVKAKMRHVQHKPETQHTIEERPVPMTELETDSKLKTILTLCYHVLRVFLMRHPALEQDNASQDNQLYVLNEAGTEGMALFIDHLDYDMGTSEVLIKLLEVVEQKNMMSPSMLDNLIDKTLFKTQQVVHALQYPSQHNMKQKNQFSHIRLLSALCYRAVAPTRANTTTTSLLLRFRDKVSEQLFGQPCLIQTRQTEAGQVQIKILEDEWRDLNMLTEEQPYALLFLQDVLDLVYSLSNKTSTKMTELTSQCISKEVCLQCLKNTKLPRILRTKFCDLLRALYIDILKFEKVPLYDYTIYIRSIESNTDNYPFGSSGIDSEFFQSLKRWIFRYLSTQNHLYTEKTKDILFLSSVLKLVYTQLRLGFFHTTRNVAILFRTLVHVLDGRTDARNEEHYKHITDKNVLRQWPERYVLTEKNQFAMNIKIQILDIFDLIFDLRLRVRMTKLANIWKSVTEDASAEYHCSPDVSGLFFMLQVFEQTELRDREESLMPILKDILKYQYAPLKQIAIVVMHRLFTDSEELFKKINSAIILKDNEQEQTYRRIKDQLTKLQAFSFFDSENDEHCLFHLSRLKDIIEELEKLLIVPLTKDQSTTKYDKTIYCRMFKSLNACDLLVNVLKSLQHIPARYYHAYIDTITACLRLLCSAVKHDKYLQSQFVLTHINLLIELTQLSPVVAEMFARLCANNLYLSTHMKEEHIIRIITTSEGYQGEYLLVLHDLLKTQGKSIKRNQDIVMRFIINNRQEYIPFDNMESLKKLHTSNYCIHLISILGTCGQGENSFGQSFARTVFSIQDIYHIVHDDQVSLALKSVMLSFLASIYIEDIELPLDVPVYDNPDMLKLITVSEVAIAQCLSGTHDPEFLNYVFRGILVFLKSVFEYHISIETAVDQQAGFSRLVDMIVKLIPLAAHDEKDLQSVLGCVDSMINVAGFRGTVQPRLLRDTLKDATMTLDRLHHEPSTKTVPIQDIANISFQKMFHDIENSMSVKQYQKEEYERLCSHFTLSNDHSSIESLIAYLNTITTTTVDRRIEHYQVATIKLLKEIAMKYIRKQSKTDPNEYAAYYEDLEIKKIKAQNTLNELGCTLVAQNLLSSPRKQIFDAALKLLISLLEGGNKNVQDKLEEYFYSIREERFFYSFHQRLQSGINASKDAQIYLARRMYKMNRQQYMFENVMQQQKKTSKHKRETSMSFLDNTNSISHKRSSHQFMLRKGMYHFGQQDKETNELYREISQLMVASNEYTSEYGHTVKDFKVMKDAMRTLQLMVEGHNLHLQTYLAKQPDNIKSFNIVLDVVEYFHAIVPLCDESSISLTIQVLDTITELAQGCLDNQVAIFNNKIINPVNIILRESYETCDPVKVNELKSKVVVCLLSLLEGGIENSETIYREMIDSLDLMAVRNNMESIYNDNLANLKLFEKLECGFLYCILVMTLLPALEQEQSALLFENNHAFQYFQSHTGKIEIVMGYGQEKQLTRVLFPIPEVCQYLREGTKQRFLWNVKRESPSSKIEDFVQQSELIIYEIENQAHVAHSQYLSLLTGYSVFWWEAAYGVSVLLNMLLMIYPKLLEAMFTHDVSPLIVACRYLLGLLHFVLWLLLTAEFYFIQLPVLINRRYGPGNNAMFWATVSESRFLYHLVMVSFSIIGLVHPGFYSIHLLDLLFRDSVLQGVISSITLNIHSISRTAILGIIVVYIHSIIAYMYFRKEFDASKGLFCGSLTECFVTVLSHGVRSGGGIGDILEPDELLRPNGWRTVFEMSFYLVVVVFLLNAIFGIIFDTFGHLRDERSSIQHDMKNSCFICSIPAVEFQRHAKKGFEDHVKNDHNIWQYLFFLVHLRNKDRTEYTGPESYVAMCLKNADYSFFPINKALDLSKDSQDENERLDKLEEMNQSLVTKLVKLEEQLEKLTDSQSRSRQNSLLLSPM